MGSTTGKIRFRPTRKSFGEAELRPVVNADSEGCVGVGGGRHYFFGVVFLVAAGVRVAYPRLSAGGGFWTFTHLQEDGNNERNDMKYDRRYKLTWPQVFIIRRMRGRLLQRILANTYGVHQTNISLIQLRKTWK